MKTNEFIYFEESELFPRIFDHADELLPELHLQKRGDKWFSSLRLDGTPGGRNDRLIMRRKNPFTVFENGSSNCLDILEEWQKRKRLGSRYEAEVDLARYFNIEDKIPMGDAKSRERFEEKVRENKKKNELSDKLSEALFSPEGKSGLEYLRDVRGYTEEEIRSAGFGYVTPALNEELGEKNQVGKISIPFRVDGKLYGYKFRNIFPDCDKKFRYMCNASANPHGYRYPQGEFLYNLGTIRLDKEDRGVIIVEGEFDAISTELKGGFSNVGALGTSNLNENHIKQLQKLGTERVYLFLDMDKAGKNGTEKAIEKLHRVGIEVYVGEIPGGKDPDEFFRNGGTSEDFDKLAKGGKHFTEYKFIQYREEWIKSYNEGDVSRSFDVFKRKIIELSQTVDAVRRRLLFVWFTDSTGGQITPEDFEEVAREKDAERLREKRKEKINETLSEAHKLSGEGKTDEALSVLTKGTEEANKITVEEKFSRYLLPRTKEEREESYRNHPDGIPTRFYFGRGADRFRGELPSDALTIIGAKTSHGKSRFLINLALDIASGIHQKKEEGRVLYFCFEENSDKVEMKILNTFLGFPLNNGGRNLSSLMLYFRNPTDPELSNQKKPDFINKDVREKFEAVSGFYFREYIDNGRIQVINDSRDISSVIGTIQYLANKVPGGVRAVIVDYIQLLHDEGFRGERYVELKRISEKLNETANKLRLPIILGAQLKREVKSPDDFEAEAISDASDIEKSADNIWFLWDSTQDVSAGVRSEWHTAPGQTRGISSLGAELALNHEFHPGTPGKLFIQIVKNRNGVRGVWEVLNVEGFSGRVLSSELGEDGKVIKNLPSPFDRDHVPDKLSEEQPLPGMEYFSQNETPEDGSVMVGDYENPLNNLPF